MGTFFVGTLKHLSEAYDIATGVVFGKARLREVPLEAKLMFILVSFPLFFILVPVTVIIYSMAVILPAKVITWAAKQLKQTINRRNKK